MGGNLMAEVEIKGLDKLLAAMKELPKAIEQKCLKVAVMTGANVIKRAAADLVVRRTGLVSKAVRIAFNRQESPHGKAVYHVFVSGKVKGKLKGKTVVPYYWRFLEFGTVKMAAKPFMRPAFDSTGREAAEVIKGKLKERIEIEAARLGGK
jgi:HK97 gp10 family phage protein